MKNLTPALAGLALAGAVACSPAHAGEDPADVLRDVREIWGLVHILRTNPGPEDIRAAALLLEMQACYELNNAVLDAAEPVGPDVARAAGDCLERMQRMASGG